MASAGMSKADLQNWMQTLGYDLASRSVHFSGASFGARHPYGPELQDLLDPAGEIRAEAVFDVEGVPTVCFFSDDGTLLNDQTKLDQIRRRIWNQNLVSLILVVTPKESFAVPVTRRQLASRGPSKEEATPKGPYSCSDIQSGDIWSRHKSWFRLEERVDRVLLKNLHLTVKKLLQSEMNSRPKLSQNDAQYLVAQLLFISYLEDRGIIGARYRDSRGVGELRSLLLSADRRGIVRLLSKLKADFNGDFLEPSKGTRTAWLTLSEKSFDTLSAFFAATDMQSGQQSLWPYDFKFIPVEMLSGIYEAFLGESSKKENAAYYTPRNLANLVVDQALETSNDLLAEKIYDGACGSGILLTTAFRRLLGEAEARREGRQLSLLSRIKLLKEHIFGSDVSEAACRVTAFSLYLSLLERLEPSDIAALCDDKSVKLPRLRGSNLFGGKKKGEFFSPTNPLVKRGDFTLFLSNPPWIEPAAGESSPADKWAQKNRVPRALRQLAADFAWRAMECLRPTGRLCMILPMSLLLKSTSQDFLSGWLERVSFRRLINFGDLKELLFDDGRKSCVVLLATPRESGTSRFKIPPTETFEYLVPKADVSLAFGRLTLHSSDRHQVQTQAIAASNRQLTTRMWGDDFDLALWAELRLRGTFASLFAGPRKRWVRRKGFHRTDNSVPKRKWVSTEPLQTMRFIQPEQLYDLPVVDFNGTQKFSNLGIERVPHLNSDLLEIFEGPRILFPDGPSPEREIRAAFTDKSGCFMSSIGAICGPTEDGDLLRFAAVYLRSSLVRYFMVTQLYQLLSDRDRVSLSDVAHFPFYLPDHHPHPDRANKIVEEISAITKALEKEDALTRPRTWSNHRSHIDDLIFAYFGLSDRDQLLVKETVELVLPRIRPYGMSSVLDMAGARPNAESIRSYNETLLDELRIWRKAKNGRGSFTIESLLTGMERTGPYGLVRVAIEGAANHDRFRIVREGLAVEETVKQLRDSGLLPFRIAEDIYFAANAIVVADNAVYLIKPQLQSAWLVRQARRDAEAIVEATTRSYDSGTKNVA